MSERIRYRKISETALESMKIFGHPHNGARYKIKLVLTENQWIVLDPDTELVAASGHSKTRGAAQLAARNALVELGVVIQTGRRERNKTLAA